VIGEVPCVGEHGSTADDCAGERNPQNEGEICGTLQVVSALATVEVDLRVQLTVLWGAGSMEEEALSSRETSRLSMHLLA